MALIRRQTFTYEVYDDQGPDLMRTYSGSWVHYIYPGEGWNNDTFTATVTPGDSFSLTFSGSRAWLYGGVLNSTNATLGWPAADYTTDGVPGGSQQPYFDATNTSIIYFKTPVLADGNHTIDVKVTGTNSTNPYIIDYFLVVPPPGGDSGVHTTRAAPSSGTPGPTVISQSTPVGPIVGGVVGGIAGIVVLVIAVWYFMFRRSRGGQAYYFEKPGAADMLAGEDRVEPFNAAPTTPASPPASTIGTNRPGPQSTYSDASSNMPLNRSFGQTFGSQPSQYTQSGPSEAGVTHVSGTSALPRTGKAALIAQQFENVQQPVQFEDSGIRFNENGEQEAGPSQLPAEVPPTYSAN